MELQLELAYRQWWLEAARGYEAKLIVLDVGIWDGGRILKPLVANVGKDFAYNVHVSFLVLSPNTYAKFSALFSLRPTLINYLVKLLRSCAECRKGYYFIDFFMSPGEQKSLDVDLSDCIKNVRGRLHHAVVLVGLCREPVSKLLSQCDVYLVVFFNE
jgi:hypothetical protein